MENSVVDVLPLSINMLPAHSALWSHSPLTVSPNQVNWEAAPRRRWAGQQRLAQTQSRPGSQRRQSTGRPRYRPSVICSLSSWTWKSLGVDVLRLPVLRRLEPLDDFGSAPATHCSATRRCIMEVTWRPMKLVEASMEVICGSFHGSRWKLP